MAKFTSILQTCRYPRISFVSDATFVCLIRKHVKTSGLKSSQRFTFSLSKPKEYIYSKHIIYSLLVSFSILSLSIASTLKTIDN